MVRLEDAESRALLESGLGEFRRGRYWHAHEHWERVWRTLAGGEKRWVQGLILITAAAWHLERGRERVARRLLELAAARFEGYPGFPGLDVGANLRERVIAAATATHLGIPPVALG